MKKNLFRSAIIFSALLGAAVLSGCTSKSAAAVQEAPQETPQETPAEPEKSWAGTIPAPEFPEGLEWLNVSEPVTMASLKGKIIVLDFWTYGCINCIHNIPYIKMLQKEFDNELVIIGVHSAKFATEGQTDNLRNIVLRYGITYPVVNDADFGVWSIWGPQAWPTLILIDPAGNVVGGRSGEGFYDTFREIIGSLVAEFDGKGMIDRTPLALKLERDGRPSTLLSFPGKVRVDPEGKTLFIADTGHNRILSVSAADGTILDIAGGSGAGFADGSFEEGTFNGPQGMTLSADGGTLYVADTNNHALRALDLKSRRITTIAGTGRQSEEYPPEPGVGTAAPLSSPWDLLREGNSLYIAMAGSHQLWVMDLDSRRVEPLAGSGAEGYLDAPAPDAELAQPSGLALSPDRKLYFADSEASSVRWVDLALPEQPVVTLAGSGKSLFEFGPEDGRGTEARFQHPLGVVWYRDGIYTADTYNHRIRRIDPRTGDVSTYAGDAAGYLGGRNPLFNEPGGIDAAQGKLYIADTNNHTVRVIDLANRETKTLVLKGYERFVRGLPVRGEEAVVLPAGSAAPGAGEIRLTLRLPAGYKPNEEAASAFVVRVEGTGISLTGPPERIIPGPKFPVVFPANFSPGQGRILVDITLIYCEEEKETLCFVERKTLEVPYRISAGSETNLSVTYTLDG